MTDKDKDKPDLSDDDGWGEAADKVAEFDKVTAETTDERPTGPDPAPEAEPSVDVSDDIESVSSADFDAQIMDDLAPDPKPEPDPDLDPEPDPEPEPYESSSSYSSDTYEPEPYTPPKYEDDDLQSAVGIDKNKTRAEKRAAKAEAKKARRGSSDDDDDDTPRVSRRTLMLIIAFAVMCVGVGVLILLGTLNSKYYYFDCGVSEITAKRGRSFPPWGSSKLSGPEWVPIALPDNAECDSAKMTDRAELESMYFDALREQAETVLESKHPENVDLAEQQLRQALKLTRPSERKDVRNEIERLLGDVEYWRARKQLEAAAGQLKVAAEKFTGSNERKPRHISDAAAWAEFSEYIANELGLGPIPLRPDNPPEPDTAGTSGFPSPGYRDAGVPMFIGPDAQPGVALPLESDAGPPPADATVPTGGVLL